MSFISSMAIISGVDKVLVAAIAVVSEGIKMLVEKNIQETKMMNDCGKMRVLKRIETSTSHLLSLLLSPLKGWASMQSFLSPTCE